MPEATELEPHDQDRLEDVIDDIQAINSNIADLELKIQQLEQKKSQWVQKKQEAEETKEDRFEDMMARYGLDPTESYTYQDGRILQKKEQQATIELEEE